ncbi:hypothetical protein [Massilia agri]|uniref:MASE1 domain-containing protein n=1 Tax=Massilia agri TaxID=1886785 RepID=A0ABT2AP62_9BURK|nr:hypothetical protein [Massilia agri]MCS0598028.1 hypothetical protein [Massilia agri]
MIRSASLQHRVARQLGYAALTIFVFLALNRVNEFVFGPFEHSAGINWVFLPAGIRLLATLLFGAAGFLGLLLVSLYLNFQHFVFQDDVRALSGAIAGAGGPYLAYLFAKHWFDLGPWLKNLTAQRLLVTGVLCGIMSPAFHHAFMWVQTGLVDWTALGVMMTGDIVGILIVLYLAKGLIVLTDPRDVEDPLA